MNIESNSARSVNEMGVKARLKKFHEWMKTSEKWNKIVLFALFVALAIDPLFLFIPEIDYEKLCIGFDRPLSDVVCVFRSLIDAFYAIHIISSLISMIGVRRLVYLILDIVSILPLPQIVVGDLSTVSSNSLVSKRILKWIIVCQYIPRVIRIFPVYKKVTKTTGRVAETKWIGAGLNLLLFLLFSYVFGAFWYVSAIGKKSRCWHAAAEKKHGNLTKLFCAHLVGDEINLYLKSSCSLIEPDKITRPSMRMISPSPSPDEFDFGIFIDVLKSEVGSRNRRDFPKRVVYCVWWGLRNLSTYAQGLVPGNSATDSLFAILICVSGLSLFAILIGNVQKYMNSSTNRVEEMEERRIDTDRWMSTRKLPDDLKKRIKAHQKQIWREFRGTDEEALLQSLSEELRLEVKGHLD
ncbi:putative cyclic nucleotide-gated ion channel 12 [Cardamine amara subsp. amara]|uniref:Cyclic nucleotide-gated ion channel 12 n=1 Tax=Cardamine amara subsp. amara TaxID=228776 RepID=A0ABD0ZYD9_CARAN